MVLETTLLRSSKILFAKGATISYLPSEEAILVNKFLETLLKSKEKTQFTISSIGLQSNLAHYSLTIKTGAKTRATIAITQAIYWEYKTKVFGNKSKEVLTSTLGAITSQ